jgi:chromosome segregation and condensation protein ScpB
LATTKIFLDDFNIKSLNELPKIKDLNASLLKK